MNVKNELKELLHQIMLKEVHKADVENDKNFNERYYGIKTSSAIYEYSIIEADKAEYELGLKFEKMFLQNKDDFSLGEYAKLPNAAKIYAKNLLIQYGIEYPQCWTFENGRVIYETEEAINIKNEEVLTKINTLLATGKINEFTRERLVLTCDYLQKINVISSKYYSNPKNHIKKLEKHK